MWDMYGTYKSAVLQTVGYRILQEYVTRTLAKYDLTTSEWSVLGLVSQNQTAHFVVISKSLGIDPPNVTTLIDGLEKKVLCPKK